MSLVLTPASVDEALRRLAEDPQAQVLAGGTDLLIQRRQRTAPDHGNLIALAGMPQLQGIAEEDGFLAIGAGTPFSRIIADPLVHRHAPLLVRAAQTIGAPAIRNMATLGGNIATASPAGDSLPPLFLLDAQIELASLAGKRLLPIAAFILGPGQTALHRGELITRILLPKAPPFTHSCFVKIGRRQALAIAVTSFAGLAHLAQDGRIVSLRMAWGSVGPTVVRFPALEGELAGATVEASTCARLRMAVQQGVSPITDFRASAHYRRLVAANLAVRFMEALGE